MFSFYLGLKKSLEETPHSFLFSLDLRLMALLKSDKKWESNKQIEEILPAERDREKKKLLSKETSNIKVLKNLKNLSSLQKQLLTHTFESSVGVTLTAYIKREYIKLSGENDSSLRIRY